METKTKPYILKKGERGALLEQYLTSICNLNNISNELHDSIQYSVNEVVSLLFDFSGSILAEKAEIRFKKTGTGLWFEVKGEWDIGSGGLTEELIDRELRRIEMEERLFVVRKLSDEMIIDPAAMSIAIFFASEDIGFTRTINRINKLQRYWDQWEKIKI